MKKIYIAHKYEDILKVTREGKNYCKGMRIRLPESKSRCRKKQWQLFKALMKNGKQNSKAALKISCHPRKRMQRKMLNSKIRWQT